MLKLISLIGTEVFWTILQICIGCLLSIPVYYLGKKKTGAKKPVPHKNHIVKDMAFIAMFSVFGMLLPLSTYGLFPIFAVLVISGFRIHILLPFIMSNIFFNMLVPYTDPSFIWKTGIKRVIFALIASMILGLLIKSMKVSEDRGIRYKTSGVVNFNHFSFKVIPGMVGAVFNQAGVYLILGITADTIFRQYLMRDILDFIFKNPHTSSIPLFLAGYNVVNPFFLLSIGIVTALLDFSVLSALLVILKPRTVLVYYVYFGGWAALLGCSAFIL